MNDGPLLGAGPRLALKHRERTGRGALDLIPIADQARNRVVGSTRMTETAAIDVRVLEPLGAGAEHGEDRPARNLIDMEAGTVGRVGHDQPDPHPAGLEEVREEPDDLLQIDKPCISMLTILTLEPSEPPLCRGALRSIHVDQMRDGAPPREGSGHGEGRLRLAAWER